MRCIGISNRFGDSIGIYGYAPNIPTTPLAASKKARVSTPASVWGTSVKDFEGSEKWHNNQEGCTYFNLTKVRGHDG